MNITPKPRFASHQVVMAAQQAPKVAMDPQLRADIIALVTDPDTDKMTLAHILPIGKIIYDSPNMVLIETEHQRVTFTRQPDGTVKQRFRPIHGTQIDKII